MIKSISIKNFQCHENLKCDFQFGVNVIHGSSDSGKSAVIRAIRAVLESKDFPASYHTWGTDGPMEVTITTDEHEVIRGRNNRKSYYRVDGKEYSAFGRANPSEVVSMLQGIACPDNLQSQFDSFYLLSNSPGEVARKIQSVCDLEAISRANKAVASEIREVSDRERAITRELSNVELSLPKYSDLPIFRKRLLRLRERQAHLEEQISNKHEWEKIYAGYQALQKYAYFASRADLRGVFEKCKESYAKNEKRRSEKAMLDKLYVRAAKYERNTSKLDERTKKIGSIKSEYEQLLLLRDANTERKETLDRLISLFQKILKNERELTSTRDELASNQFKLDELKKKVKICPLCGAKYD